MPSRRSLTGKAAGGGRDLSPMLPMPSMSLGASGDPDAMPPLSDAELCERAVQAIWRSLDEHDLVDERVRAELAAVLEPLTAMAFADRPQRLIHTLRLPNPIDPSHLYWLTRRLLTLVPELQAVAHGFHEPGGKPTADWTDNGRTPTRKM